MGPVQTLAAVFLLIALTLVGVWDIYVMAKGQEDFTISSLLREWSRLMPVFPFLAGLILGHVFLCSCSPRELKAKEDLRKETEAPRSNGKP